jgi:hypothetical protein
LPQATAWISPQISSQVQKLISWLIQTLSCFCPNPNEGWLNGTKGGAMNQWRVLEAHKVIFLGDSSHKVRQLDWVQPPVVYSGFVILYQFHNVVNLVTAHGQRPLSPSDRWCEIWPFGQHWLAVWEAVLRGTADLTSMGSKHQPTESCIYTKIHLKNYVAMSSEEDITLSHFLY